MNPDHAREPKFPNYTRYLSRRSGIWLDPPEAHNILDELARTSKSVDVPPYYIAGIYGTLGERDQAFEWLEKAYQVRDYQISPIMIDPVFSSIRSDPRYTDLLGRLGLPQ